jgi:hypothetical protein
LKLIRDFLESFIVVVLVIAGIAGILYHTFRQAGWGAAVLDKAIKLYFLHPWVMIPLTVVAVVIGAIWYDYRTAHGKVNKKYATYILYALMAAGVYFIGHYALRGSL